VSSPATSAELPIRAAATLMVVRDAPAPTRDPVLGPSVLEVLMVRRNLRSNFVGGAYVFPGGAVDAADGSAEAESLCAGRDDVGSSALLGLASGGLAYWVAAVRETFEEAGILLARHADGRMVGGGAEDEVARLGRARAALNGGTKRFVEFCRTEDFRLDLGGIYYFAHWIAPRGTPRRYDTRFFVGAAPAGQVAAPSADDGEGETVAHAWISPRQALARHRAGAIELVVPTVRNLQAIARFHTSAALLSAAKAASSAVPAVEPRVVADGNGMRIVLPGDADFEAAEHPDPGAAPAGDPTAAEFTEAMRVAALRVNRP
jgi:8-oxo-dGTP pyrophosphatase MutT (NUDIX family)